jgi:hypothetical protein
LNAIVAQSIIEDPLFDEHLQDKQSLHTIKERYVQSVGRYGVLQAIRSFVRESMINVRTALLFSPPNNKLTFCREENAIISTNEQQNPWNTLDLAPQTDTMF